MTSSFLHHVLLIIVGCFVLMACNDENDTHSENKFRVGVLLPVTGAASSTGQSVSAAFDLALDDIHDYLAATGKELEVELVVKDSETNTAASLEALKQLHEESVDYVIGPYTSANAEAVLPYANEQDMLLVSPSSVATTLAISGDNLYRLLPSDKAQAEAISALLHHDGIELVIPVVRNDVWGTGLLSDATTIFSSGGISMADALIYDSSTFNSAEIGQQISTSVELLSTNVPVSKIGVYLLSFGEGTSILSSASAHIANNSVNWYGSSAFANSNTILSDPVALEFAISRKFRSPSFAPDPAVADLWEPINTELSIVLGRTPEVFALTSYDALWMMVLSYLLADDPQDHVQFQSSFEELTMYYNGITGRTTLDENGDRKFASFNFWGIEKSGVEYDWKSYGYYRNLDNLLVLF